MRIVLFACGLAVVGSIPSPVLAVDVSRLEIINPLAACQGALPAFEGAVRKRPRGIINEGANVAFVSCGMAGQAGVDSIVDLYVEFRNEGTTTQTVSCTAVDTRNPPKFSTKSITIAAGAINQLSWNAADNAGVNYRYPAVSCGLPTGMLIQYVDRRYNEDVGN